MSTKQALKKGADPVDMMEYVRARLAATKQREWMQFAVDADVSIRTLQNINKGSDSRYGIVKALHDAMKKTETPAN